MGAGSNLCALRAEVPLKAARTPTGLMPEIIAATTKAGGWLDQSELARSLGRAASEGSLRNALAALKAEGRLEHRRLKRRRQWRLTLPFARELMAEQER